MAAKFRIKDVSTDTFFKLLDICPLKELQGFDVDTGKFVLAPSSNVRVKKYVREAKANLRNREQLGASYDSDLPDVKIAGKRFFVLTGRGNVIIREDFVRWLEANYAKYLDDNMEFAQKEPVERPEILKVNVRRYASRVRMLAKDKLAEGFDHIGAGYQFPLNEQRKQLAQVRQICAQSNYRDFYNLSCAKTLNISVLMCTGKVPEAISEMINLSALALAAAEQTAKQYIEKHEEYRDLLEGGEE